jgi:D-3-phosphoglycerate dehydrogenase/C-terminal binding protein
MGRFRVVVADFLSDDLIPEKQILGDIADVSALNAPSEAEIGDRLDTADAVMLYHNIGLSAATISRLKQCKLIVRCGVGFDNVDRVLARTRGIPVANVPDYGTEEVADSAIGMALTLARGIHFYNSQLQRNCGEWSYQQAVPILRLRGRTFGVLGLGRIGTAAAMRAKALGMNVIFYDPYRPDGTDKALGLSRVESLDEFFAQSHIVSVHSPLTDETKHIVNAKTIAKMKKGSYLVNTARGGCVDLDAIPDAIASGQLAGAGIDVFPHEPPPADHPLVLAWRNPNHPCYGRVIINPHSAFYSEEGLLDIRTKSSHACRRALLGQPLRNVVNGC